MELGDSTTVRLHSAGNSSPSAPSKLAMRRDSSVIADCIKPKVRIIHIFAPEIIETDVANFRELVQRLTGQPGESKRMIKRKPRSRSTAPRKKQKTATSGGCSNNHKKTRQLPEVLGLPGLIKEEKLEVDVEANGLWGGDHQNFSNNCSDFLDGFAGLNGFIHDLNDSFSFLY